MLLPALIVGDVHRRAAATLNRCRKEGKAKWAILTARSPERPVVLGEPEDGNAMDFYRQGFLGLDRLTADEKESIPEIDGTWEEHRVPDDQILRAIYEKYEPELNLLQRGARQRSVDPAYPPDPDLKMPEIGKSFVALRFLQGGMGLYHRLGNDLEAVELGLIGMALSQDMGRRSFVLGSMVQSSMEEQIHDSFRAILAEHQLGADALTSLARRLEALEKARPDLAEGIDWEEGYVLNVLCDPRYPNPKSWTLPKPTWRHLYSEAVMRAQAVNLLSEWLSIHRRARSKSVPERARAKQEALSLLERSNNELARSSFAPYDTVFKVESRSLLEYRLCRVAVALARYEVDQGRFPSTLEELVPRYLSQIPKCPVSEIGLRYAPGKVWSVGKDGKDDGGVIDETYGYSLEREGADAVWFVKRK